MPTSEQTILIIEDDNDILNLIEELLITEGYNVMTATNGQEGLHLLKKQSKMPNLILLDLMMPKMDGATFIDELKKEPRFSSIPVIVMSADGKANEKIQKNASVTYLKKPFTQIDAILDPIAQVLQSRQA